MKSHAFAAFVIGVALAGPCEADPALAQSKNCTSCHAVDRKIIGPAFKDVAARYGAQRDVSDALAGKIISGGSGAWGAVPMPANPQVNPAEAKQLVQWILSLKP